MRSHQLRLCIVLVVMLSVPRIASSEETYSTGLAFADEHAYQSIPLAMPPMMGTLPASVDLSPDFPPPGNQGHQSSCVAWATAYALKGYEERRERSWPLNTDAHLFSPAFIYNQIKAPGSCQQGTQYVDALNVLTRQGVATLQDFPYDENDCTRTPTPAQQSAAREFAIATWRRVNVQDDTEVKSQLAAGFPVLIGMMVDSGFMNVGAAIYSGPSGPALGGHAMVIVGYDDNRGAYKLLNSWGVGWGSGGYGWISYGALRQAVREAYVAQDIVRNGPAPAPAPAPAPTPGPVAPDPQPVPNPGAPAAVVNANINFNVPLPGGLGMQIVFAGQLTNAAGRRAQLVVKFLNSMGQPWLAIVPNGGFADANGIVATGTTPFPVASSPLDLSAYSTAIPYPNLMMIPPRGVRYGFFLVALVFVDGFVVAQSAPIPFWVTW